MIQITADNSGFTDEISFFFLVERETQRKRLLVAAIFAGETKHNESSELNQTRFLAASLKVRYICSPDLLNFSPLRSSVDLEGSDNTEL